MASSDWEKALGDVRETYLRECGGRLASMVRLLERLEHDSADAEALDQLRRDFHAFAGSGSTYGFTRVSVLGRQGDEAASAARAAGGGVGRETLQGWRGLVASIRAALTTGLGSSSAEPASSPPVERGPRRRLLVIDDDESVTSALRRLLEPEGHEISCARTRAVALAALRPLPHGVIVDVCLPDGSGYDLVEHIRTLPGGAETPVLMVSALTGLVDKVEAIHCGADAYFEKPLDLNALVRRLEHLLTRHETRPGRVLAVEDDPAQARFVRTVLEAAGYVLDVCDDPRRLESRLAAFAPDLVLMDVLLPGASGPDLVRLLRQEERHATLPVVFLTTQGGLDDRIAAARAGGDEFLMKPVHPGLLLSTVAARIERARFLRTLVSRDGLTRLLTHSAFLERAREEYARASRGHDRPAAWVMIDVDHFKAVNDRHGHLAGDRVLASLAALLRRRLRQTDTVGRYGGEEFAVLLHDLREDEAVRLVERLLDEFAALDQVAPDGSTFRVSFSAGVASLRPDSADFDSWRQLADEALYVAKRTGRSRVRPASDTPAAS